MPNIKHNIKIICEIHIAYTRYIDPSNRHNFENCLPSELLGLATGCLAGSSSFEGKIIEGQFSKLWLNHSHKAQYRQYQNTNSAHPFFIAFFSLNHVLGARFINDDFANICSKKFFIAKLPFLLLHRGVQKWSFEKYCPHFSFITLVK